MKDGLVTLETASLAKRIGFDEYTYNVFTKNKHDEVVHSNMDNFNYIDDNETRRPTQSLLHKWVRENHGLFISIYPLESGWAFDVRPIQQPAPSKTKTNEGYDSHEDALEKGLQQSLKLINP